MRTFSLRTNYVFPAPIRDSLLGLIVVIFILGMQAPYFVNYIGVCVYIPFTLIVCTLSDGIEIELDEKKNRSFVELACIKFPRKWEEIYQPAKLILLIKMIILQLLLFS